MNNTDKPITWEFNEFMRGGAWFGTCLGRKLYLVAYHGERYSLFYFPGGGGEVEQVVEGEVCKPSKAALKREFKALAHVAELHFQDTVQPVLEAALDTLKASGPNAKRRYRSIDDI